MICVFCGVSCKKCYSYGWLRNPKELLLINKVWFTRDNVINWQDPSASYSQYRENLSLNSYSEYGITKNLTMGTNLFFSLYGLMDNGSSNLLQSAVGINFFEVFLRRKLISYKNFIWSVETLAKAPGLYNENEAQFFGTIPQADIQIKNSFAISFGASKYSGAFGGFGSQFIGVDVSYRKRFALPFDEIRLEILYGLDLTKSLTVMVEFIKIVLLYYETKNPQDNSITNGFDLGRSDLNRIVTTLVCKINSGFSISFSVMFDVAGEVFGKGANNTGAISFVGGVWYRF